MELLARTGTKARQVLMSSSTAPSPRWRMGWSHGITLIKIHSSVVYDQSGNLRHGYYQSSDLSTTDNSKISTSETSSTSYTKSNAFDNNIETANDKWLAKWGGTDLWIQYDFGTPTEISSYAVYSQNADEETKSPKAWVLQGSNDNSDWGSIPSLDSRSNQVNWAEWEKRTYNLAKTENFRYYRLNFTETTGYATPTDFDDLEVWFDATDLDADGLEDTTASGTITSWFDKSANQYNAETANGTPHLNASGGPNNTPTIEIRSGDYLPINGSFFAKDHFYVFRSPAANTVWSGYGGVLGHNPASGHNQRNSNYITHHNSTYFHSNQYPSAVWRFGSQLSSPFDLDPITDYMVVRLQVNDNAPSLTRAIKSAEQPDYSVIWIFAKSLPSVRFSPMPMPIKSRATLPTSGAYPTPFPAAILCVTYPLEKLNSSLHLSRTRVPLGKPLS